MPRAISRRAALLAGLAGCAVPRRSGAQTGQELSIGSSSGELASALAAAVDGPELAPLGVAVQQRIEPAGIWRSRLLADRVAPHASIDVICLPDLPTYLLSLAVPFAPVTATAVPNLPHAAAALRVPYGVPFAFSALVIVLGSAAAAHPPESWRALWEPRWRQRIGLSDALPIHTLAAATLAAGGDMHDFSAGEKNLLALKAAGARLYPDDAAVGAALQSGEIDAAPMLLARAYQWQAPRSDAARSDAPGSEAVGRQAGASEAGGREALASEAGGTRARGGQVVGAKLSHVVPAEGAIPLTMMAAVPENARPLDQAMLYLNALLDPRAQLRLARRLGTVPTVDDVTVPPALLRQIGFTLREQQAFRTLDYAYLRRDIDRLMAFWNGRFKA